MKLITKYQLERLYTYTRTDCYALMIGDSPKKTKLFASMKLFAFASP